MSNPTPVIDIRDSLAEFLARTNEFGEANSLLVQGKVNKSLADGDAQPRFPAGESNSRTVAQWANMIDDFILQYFDQGGGQGGFTEVYRIDFRDVTNEDLNFVGSKVVIDGITWNSPTVANNGLDMNVASGSFGVTDNGLEIVGGSNSRIDPDTRTAPHIFANLYDIGNNTLSPFEADASRPWRFDVYVSAQNGAANLEHSGVALYRVPSTVEAGLPGGSVLYRSSIGFASAAADTALGLGGDGTPIEFFRQGLTPSVASVNFRTGNNLDLFTGVWNGTDDDFPVGGELHGISSARDATSETQDVVLDSRLGFRVAPFHCAENLNNTYNAVIQQIRFMRL